MSLIEKVLKKMKGAIDVLFLSDCKRGKGLHNANPLEIIHPNIFIPISVVQTAM